MTGIRTKSITTTRITTTMIREARCSRDSCILPEPHRRLLTSLFLSALSTRTFRTKAISRMRLKSESRLLGGVSIRFHSGASGNLEMTTAALEVLTCIGRRDMDDRTHGCPA